MPTKGFLLDCGVGGRTKGMEAQLPHGRGCCPQDSCARCWRGPSAPWCVCSDGERFQRPPEHLGESEFFNQEDGFGGGREFNSSLQIPECLSRRGIALFCPGEADPGSGLPTAALGHSGLSRELVGFPMLVCPLA